MIKKTLYKVFAFALAVITVTAVVILSVFYSYSDRQIKKQLESVEAVVESRLSDNSGYDFVNEYSNGKIRLTLIAADGTVIADSSQSADKLENHLDREEIKGALKDGEATAIRYSQTKKQRSYYYAKLLKNGNILRVSTQAESISESFEGYIIYIIIGVLIVITAAVFVSFGVTKSIVKPITKLGENLNNLDDVETYDELKPFVDTLKEQNRRQKVLDKQKKQFTANVSHELKTPLTSIAGYAELIESGFAKEEDVKPFASVIRKEALRLVTLSEDIIQLSQLEENDDEKLSFEDVDLYEISQRCIEALKINAKNKNVTLSLCGESCTVSGKSNLLEELVYNLCDNAIRYNKDNGSVTITVNRESDGASLIVEDTGIGIPEKYKERIFERFFRVDKSRSKETGGTGLGLAIVKHITQLHGAKLTIDSKEGFGTRLKIRFYN